MLQKPGLALAAMSQPWLQGFTSQELNGFDEIQNSRRKYPVQQIKLSQKNGERNFRLLKIYKLQICERKLVESQTQENVAKLKGIQLYCKRLDHSFPGNMV